MGVPLKLADAKVSGLIALPVKYLTDTDEGVSVAHGRVENRVRGFDETPFGVPPSEGR